MDRLPVTRALVDRLRMLLAAERPVDAPDMALHATDLTILLDAADVLLDAREEGDKRMHTVSASKFAQLRDRLDVAVSDRVARGSATLWVAGIADEINDCLPPSHRRSGLRAGPLNSLPLLLDPSSLPMTNPPMACVDCGATLRHIGPEDSGSFPEDSGSFICDCEVD